MAETNYDHLFFGSSRVSPTRPSSSSISTNGTADQDAPLIDFDTHLPNPFILQTSCNDNEIPQLTGEDATKNEKQVNNVQNMNLLEPLRTMSARERRNSDSESRKRNSVPDEVDKMANLLYDDPNTPVDVKPSSSTMAKKFASVAKTVISKFNQNQEVKPGTAKSATVLPSRRWGQRIEPNEVNGNGPFSYDPPYIKDEIYDFQNRRIGPPHGQYFQLKAFNDVIVTDVQTPDCFYVRNKETSKELERMEASMKEWYDAYWIDKPSLTSKSIFEGSFYACYVEEFDWWYRCRVEGYHKRLAQQMEVVVQLLDYGSTELVKLDCILPLRSVYGRLPIQAALANLQSIEDGIPWKPHEIQQFKTDVMGKSFQAFITEHKYIEGEIFDWVTLALLETVDGEERPYSLGDRSNSSSSPN